MKLLKLTFLGFLLSFVGYAQQAEIVVFRHDMRWVDETKFPNYFLINEVQDSIFNATELEIRNYLKASTVKLPEEVSYKIINGFGNQKIRMPRSIPENDFELGIFSFITRATVGSSVVGFATGAPEAVLRLRAPTCPTALSEIWACDPSQ